MKYPLFFTAAIFVLVLAVFWGTLRVQPEENLGRTSPSSAQKGFGNFRASATQSFPSAQSRLQKHPEFGDRLVKIQQTTAQAKNVTIEQALSLLREAKEMMSVNSEELFFLNEVMSAARVRTNAIPELADIVSSKCAPGIRDYAIQSLGLEALSRQDSSKRDQVLPLLMSIASDPSDLSCGTALLAAQRVIATHSMNPEPLRIAAISAVNDPRTGANRAGAFQVCSALGEPAAISVAQRIAASPDEQPTVRAAAINYLTAHEVEPEFFSNLSADPSKLVSRAATLAISKLHKVKQ